MTIEELSKNTKSAVTGLTSRALLECNCRKQRDLTR